MKKLTSLLALCLFVIVAKSQTPTLNTLIRYVGTPIEDLTEELISINGYELTKSEVVDSVLTMEFNSKDVTLTVKKTKGLTNEISLVCNKEQYDNLHKSFMQFNPRLTASAVTDKGYIVRNYWGDDYYGYKLTIAPKSVFVFQVYNIPDFITREDFEKTALKASSMEKQRI